MSSAVLDKYRRAVTDRPKIETVEGQPYKAFDSAGTRQARLDFRPGYDAQRIFSYFDLKDAMYAGDFMMTLRCPPAVVIEIQGRNLGELIDMFRQERLTFVQEYIPEWHTKPGPDEPCIDKIEITDANLSKKSGKPGKH